MSARWRNPLPETPLGRNADVAARPAPRFLERRGRDASEQLPARNDALLRDIVRISPTALPMRHPNILPVSTQRCPTPFSAPWSPSSLAAAGAPHLPPPHAPGRHTVLPPLARTSLSLSDPTHHRSISSTDTSGTCVQRQPTYAPVHHHRTHLHHGTLRTQTMRSSHHTRNTDPTRRPRLGWRPQTRPALEYIAGPPPSHILPVAHMPSPAAPPTARATPRLNPVESPGQIPPSCDLPIADKRVLSVKSPTSALLQPPPLPPPPPVSAVAHTHRTTMPAASRRIFDALLQDEHLPHVASLESRPLPASAAGLIHRTRSHPKPARYARHRTTVSHVPAHGVGACTSLRSTPPVHLDPHLDAHAHQPKPSLQSDRKKDEETQYPDCHIAPFIRLAGYEADCAGELKKVAPKGGRDQSAVVVLRGCQIPRERGRFEGKE
ncbi:hypothetical protein B0H11DRAFT_1911545 [Mycena galericulata]|nr:hypothetical protein B0H11DRAFT_1911545 [Mycena galericulata]